MIAVPTVTRPRGVVHLLFAGLALLTVGAATASAQAAAPVLIPNTPRPMLLSADRQGPGFEAGPTDDLPNRTNSTTPDYTYDVQALYFDIDTDPTGAEGKADRAEWFQSGSNAADPTYINESNRARRVTVLKGPAWNNPTQVGEVDLVLALPGTEQPTTAALSWFFGQYPDSGAPGQVSAYPTARSSALVDAAAALGSSASDLLVAVMEPGRSVENGSSHQWSVYRTFTSVRPPTAPNPGAPGPELLFAPAYGDLMADVKRVIEFKNAIKADNPRIGRVYLFGFSAGGSLVHSVACFFPDEFDGYGAVDIALNPSLYRDCGQRHQNDGTIVTRQLEQQVGRSPVRLITHPRPMFVVANTNSTKATNDLGRFVGGIVPNTAACGFGVSPLTDRSFVDTALCQEDWANNLLGSEIAIDSSRPRLTARNADVLEPGHFDYESTIERYLRRLGLFAAHYRSSLAGNPCAGTGALECTAFVQASAERCLTGGGTSYFREPVTGQAPEHLAMQAVQWTWDQGSGRAAAYLEVSGGQHAVPGRGRACGAPGLTHDVDAATQFLVFMAQHGGLVQR